MPIDPGLHSSSPATPERRADFLFSASRKHSKARLQMRLTCPSRTNHYDQGVAPAEGLGSQMDSLPEHGRGWFPRGKGGAVARPQAQTRDLCRCLRADAGSQGGGGQAVKE